MNITQIADLVVDKLSSVRNQAGESYMKTNANLGFFVVDDLLPVELALRLHACFPNAKPNDKKKEPSRV